MRLVAPILLLIGLLFSVAMVFAITDNIEKKETANKAEYEIIKQELEVAPEAKQTNECDIAYVKGYTRGYNNGIKAYCDIGVDVMGIAPGIMCYDIGYERGFKQGVIFADQHQTECLKFKPKDIDIENELIK